MEALRGTGIHVAAVSTAFPHGLAPLATRLGEIEASVADGADEIDVVIPRGLVFGAKWRELHDEIVRVPRRLRRGASESHPRHRRSVDAAQRGARLDGGDDGGRRFHQDVDRQGKRQCHAAGRPRHGAGDPRLFRGDRLS